MPQEVTPRPRNRFGRGGHFQDFRLVVLRNLNNTKRVAGYVSLSKLPEARQYWLWDMVENDEPSGNFRLYNKSEWEIVERK
jgi:hypothetical protein